MSETKEVVRAAIEPATVRLIQLAVRFATTVTNKGLFIQHQILGGATQADAEKDWQALETRVGPRIMSWGYQRRDPATTTTRREMKKAARRAGISGRPLVYRPDWMEETRWAQYRKLVDGGQASEAARWRRTCEAEWANQPPGEALMPLGWGQAVEHVPGPNEATDDDIPQDLSESWTWDIARRAIARGKLTAVEAVDSGMPEVELGDLWQRGRSERVAVPSETKALTEEEMIKARFGG